MAREPRIGIDVAIVGGGIVGIAAAALLAEAGRDVTLIDRDGICEGASAGNAASFAFSDILPLAHKGMLRKVPRWLADPLGPLAIPPAYLPRLLPWLFRFWRAGNPRSFAGAVAAQAAIMRLAEVEWTSLIDRAGLGAMLHEDGSLELYESEEEFRASLPGWTERDRFGISYRHVKGDELADLQPGLARSFGRATFVPDWKTAGDPQRFGKALWAHAEELGARFRLGDVGLLLPGEAGVTVQLRQGITLRAGHVVIAAGAWSHILARQLDDRIPLEAERGYNTTLPPGAFDVRRHLIFGGHGFVVTPLETGVRIGGAVELGGLRLPPNFARAEAMLKKAERFLPGLRAEGGRQWMGHRPSLPDSLPVIGRASGDARVHYAFGHGHLGLTQAAATGRLIVQAILVQSPAIDLAPFSPRRF